VHILVHQSLFTHKLSTNHHYNHHAIITDSTPKILA